MRAGTAALMVLGGFCFTAPAWATSETEETPDAATEGEPSPPATGDSAEKKDEDLPKRLQWSANVRFRLSASETDQTDGTESDTSEARLRLRGGLAWIIAKTLDAKIRFAGSVSSEDNDYTFEIDTAGPLQTGQATFDEIYLKWGPSRQLMFYLGRFQTQFQLRGVFPKSLDRKDSNNMRITWTDGLHVFHRGAKGWSL
ncbi:MAG: putative porin, partial [Acidobacteria bacterium]|nr:putative porin [Acidobacteriota bacterium]